MALEIQLPIRAPTTPSTTVSQIGIGCRPGRMSFAITPMIRPATIAQMIWNIEPPLGGVPPGLPEIAIFAACRPYDGQESLGFEASPAAGSWSSRPGAVGR